MADSNPTHEIGIDMNAPISCIIGAPADTLCRIFRL
jgi:hypothetical protein